MEPCWDLDACITSILVSTCICSKPYSSSRALYTQPRMPPVGQQTNGVSPDCEDAAAGVAAHDRLKGRATADFFLLRNGESKTQSQTNAGIAKSVTNRGCGKHHFVNFVRASASPLLSPQAPPCATLR